MTTEMLTTRTVDIIAAEINGIKQQTRNFVLQSSIEIGRRLVEAKSMVAHGEWGDWLKEHVDYSQSTANNLMKVYHEYGSNSQAFGNLSYTQAVALLAVPAEERELFVKENDIENMSTRDLQQAIKDKKKLEKELELVKKEIEREREEQGKLFGELERKVKEKEEKIKQLDNKLKEAQHTGNTEEVDDLLKSKNELDQQLQESLERIKELEKQLNEKPIEVQATKVIEKIPEEVEQELYELRKKQKQPNSEFTMRFKVHFDILVKGFNDLLLDLEEIKENESDQYEKYKKAANDLLAQMAKQFK